MTKREERKEKEQAGMSTFALVNGQLRREGNPIPPGVAPGPGQAMPNYKGLPGKPWNPTQGQVPPTPPTQKHLTGFPSNNYITSAHVARPWRNGYQDMLREGQIVFVGRSINPGDNNQMIKQVNHYQLNAIMATGYDSAVRRLSSGDVPDGVNIAFAQFASLNEVNLVDYLGREETISEGESGNVLREALKLIKLQEFKYLLPCGMMWHWNLLGIVNNMSYGTSPEVRMDTTLTKSVVPNLVVAKRVYASNLWGGTKVLPEGGKLGIILRRRETADGGYGAPEIVPWAARGYETPPIGDRFYTDFSGGHQPGFFFPLGYSSDQEGPPPAEQKRRIAIGNGNQYTMSKVHDALGSLSQVVIQLGV